MQITHAHTQIHTHALIAKSYGLIGHGFEFRLGQEIFCLLKPPRKTRGLT